MVSKAITHLESRKEAVSEGDECQQPSQVETQTMNLNQFTQQAATVT